jgi:transposase
MPGTKYSAELKAKAVRLVREHRGDYPSEWAAIGEIARRLQVGSSETLRKWVRQAEVDDGKAPGTTSEQAAEVRVLRRKVSELERTIEILTEATRFFAREADPLRR